MLNVLTVPCLGWIAAGPYKHRQVEERRFCCFFCCCVGPPIWNVRLREKCTTSCFAINYCTDRVKVMVEVRIIVSVNILICLPSDTAAGLPPPPVFVPTSSSLASFWSCMESEVHRIIITGQVVVSWPHPHVPGVWVLRHPAAIHDKGGQLIAGCRSTAGFAEACDCYTTTEETRFRHSRQQSAATGGVSGRDPSMDEH